MSKRSERAPRSAIALEFRDVSRRFLLYHEQRNSFQDWFIGLVRPRGHAEEFWALRDVSFTVGWGEALGVLGRNGAGKSTLLKLVSRILEPTSGDIQLFGETHAMLELGAGFHPELSGRDNVFLNGSIYGHDRRTMQERYDSIVAFAELEQFIDTPVKHYSSGMFMRLGFSIAIHMDPEILVIDEVMAVGDANFQAKGHHALLELKERGTTILFVSHNAQQIRNFCDRAILLENGHLIDSGLVNDVVDHYERLLDSTASEIELMRLRVVDTDGRTVDKVRPGQDLCIESMLRLPEGADSQSVSLGVDLFDADGVHLFGRNSPLPARLDVHSVDGGNLATARSVIRNLPLRSGDLTLVATLQNVHDEHVLGRREAMVSVRPDGIHSDRGLLALDYDWQWSTPDRVDTASREGERDECS